MLVMTRTLGESIIIYDAATGLVLAEVSVQDIRVRHPDGARPRVRIGISAGPTVRMDRREVWVHKQLHGIMTPSSLAKTGQATWPVEWNNFNLAEPTWEGWVPKKRSNDSL